jgi:DNA gyrase/topoisomerase IV subunit B
LEKQKEEQSLLLSDPSIFTQTIEYSYDTLSARMRELSYLKESQLLLLIKEN